MTEPDVTLTDFALAAECAVFCVLALRWSPTNPRLRYWWVVLFASIGLAALLGGIVHGFFGAPGPANLTLWRSTLLAIGLTSLATWMIGALLQLPERLATWVGRAAILQVIVYAWIVLFLNSSFFVAIVTYAPATLFLLVAMILTYRRAPSRPLALAITGLTLTFVAAAVQQLKVALHPVYFNHNALYHVIQFVALWLIFIGAKWVVTAPPVVPREESGGLPGDRD
jgi:hypothetical protein